MTNIEERIIEKIKKCNICPRECNIDRTRQRGFCGADDKLNVALASIHSFEEPPISGSRGSGTVFFSNCNLKCCFCQNFDISHDGFGKPISIERLSYIFLELEKEGVHNINLVTPTHYTPMIKEALIIAKNNGLSIPVVYNSSGYEKVETLRSLEGLIDIYLPDIKYYSDKYSIKYSGAPSYFKYASAAVLEMQRQVGPPVFDEDGMMKKGLMIRHMTLPGLLFDSKKIIDFVIENLSEKVYLNLMCQYIPMYDASKFPEINKKVNKKHYDALVDYALAAGLKNGFIQDFDSANTSYTPKFNLGGV